MTTARTTRRQFALGTLATLASGSLLSACGSEEREGAGEDSGPWRFTDDRGRKLERDARPKRIVANEATAAALWYAGVQPVGIFAGSPLKESTLLEGVDLEGIRPLGEVYGEIDLERLAALKPDVIVTAFNPDQAPVLFGFKNESQQKEGGGVRPDPRNQRGAGHDEGHRAPPRRRRSAGRRPEGPARHPRAAATTRASPGCGRPSARRPASRSSRSPPTPTRSSSRDRRSSRSSGSTRAGGSR
jgi:hypothetical protein